MRRSFLVSFAMFLAVAGLSLTACGDDDSSFAPRDEDSSSSVCEDCDESSSSVILSGDSHEGSYSSSEKLSSSRENDKSSSSEKIKSSSSNKVVSSSSEKQESSSSSSVKQSSSSKDGESSSSKQNDSSSSKKEESSSSVYTPFDHSQTLAGAWRIGEDRYKTFTDPRNGRSYYYITITGHPLTGTGNVSVTVMAENLNIGVDVSGDQDQNDDTKIERYCYNNDTTKCDEFGGLYQWAEMMQLPSRCNTESCADLIQENHQGICPDGWRLFTYEDYIVVLTAEGNDDGVKGMRSTYGFSGTNYSGFSLTGAGARTIEGGVDFLKKNIFWFYPQEHDYDKTIYSIVGYVSASNNRAPQPDDGELKTYGFSVRCTKLEE